MHSKLGVETVPQKESDTSHVNRKKLKDSKMTSESTSLSIPVSSNSGTSSSRNKVSLKPGRSLMDWIRFTNSGQDLSGTGGKVLAISVHELAKHNTVNDAWIALRGKVYNITPYLEYHPGGEDELMRGAGRDATDLFNQIHRWVNAESMLKKCFVGVLKKPWTFDDLKFPQIKQLMGKKSDVPSADCLDTSKKSDNRDKDVQNKESEYSSSKSDWSILPLPETNIKEFIIRSEENDESKKLFISSSCIAQQDLITDLVKQKLFIRMKINSSVYFLNIDLSDSYQEHYKVSIQDSSIELIFKKYKVNKLNSKSTSDSKNHSINPYMNWRICESKEEYFIYWPCKLISKASINHNTLFLIFLLPPGAKMQVPLGCHVKIKCAIEGVQVTRSYTPVCSSLKKSLSSPDLLDSSKIAFIIKIYPTGMLTPVIKECSLGDSVYISNYSGTFSEKFIETSDSIIMLAAGTGITPMIRIIHSVVTDNYVKRSLQLLFFNKTEEDIIWRKELESCSDEYSEFKIAHVLSEPSDDWRGRTGRISRDILAEFVSKQSSVCNERILICGPLPFTEAALSYLNEFNLNQEDIFAFTGT